MADFRPAKRLKNHTLWGDTPLYSRIGHVPYSYRGVPPGQCHRLIRLNEDSNFIVSLSHAINKRNLTSVFLYSSCKFW